MRTRRKQPDVPAPDRPWDEILPGLWMGGHEYRGPAGQPVFAVVRGEFDLVQTLTRARPDEKDKGGEAAKAALAMLALKQRFGG